MVHRKINIIIKSNNNKIDIIRNQIKMKNKIFCVTDYLFELLSVFLVVYIISLQYIFKFKNNFCERLYTLFQKCNLTYGYPMIFANQFQEKLCCFRLFRNLHFYYIIFFLRIWRAVFFHVLGDSDSQQFPVHCNSQKVSPFYYFCHRCTQASYVGYSLFSCPSCGRCVL